MNIGDRVRLVRINDPYCPFDNRLGLEGTVTALRGRVVVVDFGPQHGAVGYELSEVELVVPRYVTSGA